MSQIVFDQFLSATWETILMVSVSAALAFLLGLPIAVLLVLTRPGGIISSPVANRVGSAVINGFRSTPFLILLVALIPFTRLVAGTSIGLWAAVVPLTVSAAPFFARIAEVSLREVDRGLIEAAQAMGGRRWHIVWHVLLPEALPSIIGGFTVTLVAMISMSAMAGAVGAGGLGDLAIRYGYQRFDTVVMVSVITILVVIVSIVQRLGDNLARRLDHRR